MTVSVTHALKHEHRVIERVLRALEGVCFRLACEEVVPIEPLSEMVDFVSRYVDAYHHAKEENALFPALQEKGIVREGGPLGAIEHEHETERRFIDELSSAVKGMKTGNDVSRQVFIEAARNYIAHLTAHMQQEEAILFRLAEELIDAPDGEAVAEGFRQAQKEFGESAMKGYENLATALEEKWAL